MSTRIGRRVHGRWWLIVAAPAVVVACAPDRVDEIAGAGEGRCPAAESSRWSPAGGEYRATFVRGEREDEWLGGLGGVTYADSILFVADLSRGRVLVLDAELRLEREIGRPGKGPGELEEAWSPLLAVASPDWTGVVGDTLLVFDGQRLSRFSTSGAFIDHVRRDGDLERLYPREWRVRYTEAGIFFPIDGYNSIGRTASAPVPWRLRRHHGGRTRAVLDLTLPPLPRRGDVTITSALQATPYWDIHRACVVATDGSSPWLYRSTIDGGEVARLPVDLPEPEISTAEIEEEARMRAAASRGQVGEPPEPTALRRVARLIVDPDGWVWILPVQPNTATAPRLEVHLVSLATGQVEIDTVPAFPKEFGRPGVYYAQVRGPNREVLLARFDRPAPDP